MLSEEILNFQHENSIPASLLESLYVLNRKTFLSPCCPNYKRWNSFVHCNKKFKFYLIFHDGMEWNWLYETQQINTSTPSPINDNLLKFILFSIFSNSVQVWFEGMATTISLMRVSQLIFFQMWFNSKEENGESFKVNNKLNMFESSS